MNALAVIAPAPGFSAWVAEGKALLVKRTQTEWELADWLASGRERYVDQAGFDFLADELGIAPKQLKTAERVARAFPPALRAAGLTYEHHEAVANLPTHDALAVLKRAEADGLDDRETRIAAVKRKAEIAPSLLPEEDWEQAELVALTRAWNRARPSVRSEFMEMAEEANGGDIDA